MGKCNTGLCGDKEKSKGCKDTCKDTCKDSRGKNKSRRNLCQACPVPLKFKARLVEVCEANAIGDGEIGFDSLESQNVRWIVVSVESHDGCETEKSIHSVNKGDVVRLSRCGMTENLDYCVLRVTETDCRIFLYVRAQEVIGKNFLIKEGEKYELSNFGPKVAGPQGEVGPTGMKGDMGDMGLMGLTGPQGATGPEGPMGVKGDAGGPNGDTGAPGVTGAQGLTGAQGCKGMTGAKGPDGDKGPDGNKGLTGERGPPGGPTGPPGVSSEPFWTNIAPIDDFEPLGLVASDTLSERCEELFQLGNTLLSGRYTTCKIVESTIVVPLKSYSLYIIDTNAASTGGSLEFNNASLNVGGSKGTITVTKVEQRILKNGNVAGGVRQILPEVDPLPPFDNLYLKTGKVDCTTVWTVQTVLTLEVERTEGNPPPEAEQLLGLMVEYGGTRFTLSPVAPGTFSASSLIPLDTQGTIDNIFESIGFIGFSRQSCTSDEIALLRSLCPGDCLRLIKLDALDPQKSDWVVQNVCPFLNRPEDLVFSVKLRAYDGSNTFDNGVKYQLVHAGKAGPKCEFSRADAEITMGDLVKIVEDDTVAPLECERVDWIVPIEGCKEITGFTGPTEPQGCVLEVDCAGNSYFLRDGATTTIPGSTGLFTGPPIALPNDILEDFKIAVTELTELILSDRLQFPGIIKELVVFIGINHTRPADLVLKLRNDATGSVFDLDIGQGQTGPLQNGSWKFGTNVPVGTLPLGSSYCGNGVGPTGSRSNFDDIVGEPTNGSFTLCVSDGSTGSTGDIGVLLGVAVFNPACLSKIGATGGPQQQLSLKLYEPDIRLDVNEELRIVGRSFPGNILADNQLFGFGPTGDNTQIRIEGATGPGGVGTLVDIDIGATGVTGATGGAGATGAVVRAFCGTLKTPKCDAMRGISIEDLTPDSFWLENNSINPEDLFLAELEVLVDCNGETTIAYVLEDTNSGNFYIFLRFRGLNRQVPNFSAGARRNEPLTLQLLDTEGKDAILIVYEQGDRKIDIYSRRRILSWFIAPDRTDNDSLGDIDVKSSNGPPPVAVLNPCKKLLYIALYDSDTPDLNDLTDGSPDGIDLDEFINDGGDSSTKGLYVIMFDLCSYRFEKVAFIALGNEFDIFTAPKPSMTIDLCGNVIIGVQDALPISSQGQQQGIYFFNGAPVPVPSWFSTTQGLTGAPFNWLVTADCDLKFCKRRLISGAREVSTLASACDGSIRAVLRGVAPILDCNTICFNFNNATQLPMAADSTGQKVTVNISLKPCNFEICFVSTSDGTPNWTLDMPTVELLVMDQFGNEYIFPVTLKNPLTNDDLGMVIKDFKSEFDALQASLPQFPIKVYECREFDDFPLPNDEAVEVCYQNPNPQNSDFALMRINNDDCIHAKGIVECVKPNGRVGAKFPGTEVTLDGLVAGKEYYREKCNKIRRCKATKRNRRDYIGTACNSDTLFYCCPDTGCRR